MRILVCGGRDYNDERRMRDILALQPFHSHLIHGAARGADMLSDKVARSYSWTIDRFPADWKRLGKRAGFVRNQRMLDEGKPDLVIAFPGGKGTADMVRRAKAAGVKVVEIK